MAYSFKEKKRISEDIADIQHIGCYRMMLSSYGSRLSRTVMTDRVQLARALVYELLKYCTREEIISFSSTSGTGSGYVRHSQGKQPDTTPPAQARRKQNKFEEYPGIDWKSLDNPMVRMADSIFSDRVNCFSRLREIDSALEDEADRSVIAEFVDKSIRMELCFDELRSMDSTGKFVGVHPFIVQKDEREHVLELLKTDPDRYFEERKNLELNITRYTSYLKSPRIDEDKKKKYKEYLDRHTAVLKMYRECFNDFMNEKDLHG